MVDHPKTDIPLLTVGQEGAETRVNESIYMTHALLYGVESSGDNTPAVGPADGDTYILGAAPTGVWAGQAKNLAVYVSTAWKFVSAVEGMQVHVNDTDVSERFDGTDWVVSGPIIEVVRASRALTGAQTYLAPYIHWLQPNTDPIPVIRACSLAKCAVTIRHSHGSDPGDWTLTIRKYSAVPIDTFAFQLNAASSVFQTTTGTMTGSFAAGDMIEVYCGGPSCTSPRINLAFELVYSAV